MRNLSGLYELILIQRTNGQCNCYQRYNPAVFGLPAKAERQMSKQLGNVLNAVRCLPQLNLKVCSLDAWKVLERFAGGRKNACLIEAGNNIEVVE